MNGIMIDGRRYRVRMVYNTLIRSFEIRSGDNEGYMLSGLHERDLLGSSYSYKMGVEPDPRHPEDYDAFYHAISAPVDRHAVTVPFGQGFFTFEAEVRSGEDTWRGTLAGVDRWSGLTVTFTSIAPQRTPEKDILQPGVVMDKKRRLFKDRLGRLIIVRGK